MEEKAFKKHLQDLAHGHHHPEEHDWDKPHILPSKETPARKSAPKRKTTSKSKRKAA
jgi:hypothetical protein